MEARYKCNYCGGLSRKNYGECKYCGAIDAFSLVKDEDEDEDKDENIAVQTENEPEEELVESEEEDEFEEKESVTIGSKITSSLCIIITGVMLSVLPYACSLVLSDMPEIFSAIFSAATFLGSIMLFGGAIKLACELFMFEEQR